MIPSIRQWFIIEFSRISSIRQWFIIGVSRNKRVRVRDTCVERSIGIKSISLKLADRNRNRRWCGKQTTLWNVGGSKVGIGVLNGGSKARFVTVCVVSFVQADWSGM
jgi:hypothetical protein